MIDTHCHLTFPGLHDRVEVVIQRARDAGVDRVISVGTTPADARAAAGLADRFGGVYATVGVHPHYAEQAEQRDVVESMRGLIRHDRVVALGEMGLDWHYPDPPRNLQRRVLDWQLEVAAEVDAPIVIHNREATDDLLPVLKQSGIPGGRFVFHCFTGSPAELDRVLEFGATVGFTGVVTFRSAQALSEAAALVPLDRVLIETDAPYLTPEPHRKVRPNEPRYLVCTAECLARGRGMTTEEFAAAVDANAVRVFGLGGGV